MGPHLRPCWRSPAQPWRVSAYVHSVTPPTELILIVVNHSLINLSFINLGEVCSASSVAMVNYFLLLLPAGLETFISTAKKLPSSDLYDVVEGYIKISMECAEIFKLLDREKHVEAEVSWKTLLGVWDWPILHRVMFITNRSACQMMLIFESLEMILLRTASDLSHFNMVGNAIVKKTVSGYMKLLQGSLHSDNHRLV